MAPVGSPRSGRSRRRGIRRPVGAVGRRCIHRRFGSRRCRHVTGWMRRVSRCRWPGWERGSPSGVLRRAPLLLRAARLCGGPCWAGCLEVQRLGSSSARQGIPATPLKRQRIERKRRQPPNRPRSRHPPPRHRATAESLAHRATRWLSQSTGSGKLSTSSTTMTYITSQLARSQPRASRGGVRRADATHAGSAQAGGSEGHGQGG